MPHTVICKNTLFLRNKQAKTTLFHHFRPSKTTLFRHFEPLCRIFFKIRTGYKASTLHATSFVIRNANDIGNSYFMNDYIMEKEI